MRENLPVEVLRVCVQTHPVGFDFFFFNQLIKPPLSPRGRRSSAAGGAQLSSHRAAETRGRGEGRWIPRAAPPAPRRAAPAGAEQRCGQVLPRPGGFQHHPRQSPLDWPHIPVPVGHWPELVPPTREACVGLTMQ